LSIPTSSYAATVSGAAQGNITSVGTLTSLAVTGNISGGNILGGANVNATTHTGSTVSVTSTVTGSQFNGSGAGLTSIPGANVTGTLSIPTSSYAATVSSAAQGNITSLGTLTGLTINNATTAITNAATTGTGNIGASGAVFNTVFAKATSAQYADLAEMYAADAYYTPGTVLEFGGPEEITLSDSDMSTRIIGVVSTDPAHLMNSDLQANHPTAVALIGRVPCSVVGTVRRGDMMVSAGNGAARSESNPAPGSMIGKAVQDHNGDTGVIEILVGRL
jgi:hypothetical protein